MTTYHGPQRAVKPPKKPRFIAWDGEGVNLRGPDRKQSYVLFGCSTGEVLRIDYPKELTLQATDLFDFILSVGERNPGAKHIGFAFGYDSNMLVQTLSTSTLERLHRLGNASLSFDDGTRYYLEFRPGKWFFVFREKDGKKCSVRIEDIFGYFTCSFVDAYAAMVGPVPSIVLEGKAMRESFTIEDFKEIEEYWHVEIQLLEELADALRENLHSAGLAVNRWYGPGALASYVLKRESIRAHMQESPLPVYEAARYAYAGGRFELFRMGRESRRKIFAVDINSAYPYAITKLPSLANGKWIPTSGPPEHREVFAVYHVRIHPSPGRYFFTKPGPLFHRDKVGRISFPWKLDGWYWAPEVWEAVTNNPELVEVLEGWEFVEYADVQKVLPFAWVADSYQQRLQWKAEGNPSQLALKLMMNSLYGKMAQRVGWNPETMRAPVWHQLEWAGWVTSLTRANLYAVMVQLEPDSLVSAETDAVYTTDPSVMEKLTLGNGLGEWGIDVYDEIIYLQSGLAWLRKADEWSDKRRGLDRDSFRLQDCIEYTKTLRGRKVNWEPYRGKTTRFIGLGAAIASGVPTKVKHCVWQTAPREITVGDSGKRGHHPSSCKACRVSGASAYETMHDLYIRSNALKDPVSFPHDIPWMTQTPYEWREQDGELGEIHMG